MRGVGVLYRELKHHLVDVAPEFPLCRWSANWKSFDKGILLGHSEKSGNSVLLSQERAIAPTADVSISRLCKATCLVPWTPNR